MKEPIAGNVVADILEIRFAFAGKVASVRKKPGEAVSKGEKIAAIDRTPLQIELDKQLADYERSRADFELFGLKYRDQHDDVTKYNRQSQQASLNTAVKEIESAKYKLDQTDLICPINGTILDHTLIPGLFITPAGNSVSVANRDSLHFSFTVVQEDLPAFVAPIRLKCRFTGIEKEFEGTSVPPQWGKNGIFTICVFFDNPAGLLPGMLGEAKIVV